MNWMFFLIRPYSWLFFVITGMAAQTESKSEEFSQEKTFATNSEPALKQDLFDFWVGEWDVHWEEEDGKIGKGTNRVKYILDSTAIEENFIVHSGTIKGFRGKSLSTFRKKIKDWKQVWIDNDGGYLEFTGDIENGFPVFKTDLVKRNGKDYKFKMVFRDINTSGFIWDWKMSTDQGNTWDLKWQIFYTKK